LPKKNAATSSQNGCLRAASRSVMFGSAPAFAGFGRTGL
jgi:hypothetical protein